jgi:hypothetical protein
MSVFHSALVLAALSWPSMKLGAWMSVRHLKYVNSALLDAPLNISGFERHHYIITALNQAIEHQHASSRGDALDRQKG